jgi:hypothetical protein
MNPKTLSSIALPALLVAALLLPSAAAEDVALGETHAAPEPFVVRLDFVDGVPVLSGSAGAADLCSASVAPDDLTGQWTVGDVPGFGVGVSCNPEGDTTTGAPTCRRVEVGAAAGSGGYARVSAYCGAISASCTAPSNQSCFAWSSGSSSGNRGCSFYMRAPASAYCAFG